MRRIGNVFIKVAILCALSGCGEGSNPAAQPPGATAPPAPPADQEKLFKKPGPKGAPAPGKGAFLTEPVSRTLLVS